MTLLEEISRGRDYNMHGHTQFCDGRAVMEDFVKAAIDCGMKHYGFTPHSPLPLKSSCNMALDDVPLYFEEIDRLRELYGDRISIHAGMEIDYLSDKFGPADEYFAELPLDFSIGSVHFVPSPDGYTDIDGKPAPFIRKIDEVFGGDIEGVMRTYFAQVEAMIDAGGFDIVGHYDKILNNASIYSPGIADRPWVVKTLDRITDMIVDKGLAVEINTKARPGMGCFFPAERHWARLKRAGVTILVNSDAHYPDLIEAGRRDAFIILDHI